MLRIGTSARPLTGIALNLTALLVLVCMAGLVKAVQQHVPTGQAVFARAAFSLPLILAWIAMQGPLMDGLRMVRPGMHLLRGVLGTVTLVMNFTALSLLPLAENTAIGFAAPVLTLVFAILFLGEKVRLFRWAAVGLGLVGVMVVIWPQLDRSSGDDLRALGALLALGAACTAALVKIVLRKMVVQETTPSIVFYFALTATLVASVTAPGWVWPEPRIAVMLVATGLLGGVGQLLMTASYRYADASALAPFWYVQLFFASAIGYLFFGEIPGSATLLGALLVIAAGLLILWRESRLGRKVPVRNTTE